MFWKTFVCGERLKNFCEDLSFFFFFFWRALALVSLVLGLGLVHSCPWPRECLSSERLSLASDFFVSLALASSLVSSTPPLLNSSGWTSLGPCSVNILSLVYNYGREVLPFGSPTKHYTN